MHRREFLTLLAAAGVLGSTRRGTWRAGAAGMDITPAPGIWMAGFAARTCPAEGVALPLFAKALALEDERRRRAVLVAVDLLGVTASMTARVASAVRRRHGLPREALLVNASHTHSGPVTSELLGIAYDLPPGQPVLDVEAADGRTLAVVFGYACHNTTLQAGWCRLHGDYAGVAQALLERRHPGATALFVAGCGADANPEPRGTLELVEQHGAALADAVGRARESLVPVAGPLRLAYGVASLPFAPAPARTELEARLSDADVYQRRHARFLLDALARAGRLPAMQPAPVQVWRFGETFTLVALGGEVVADYALRLKRDYPARRIWVAGYSNDVFGYLPSLRVLKEGGYEGGGAMIYYGRPGPFAPSVEERIHSEVRSLMGGPR